jgi:hypothetical protein
VKLVWSWLKFHLPFLFCSWSWNFPSSSFCKIVGWSTQWGSRIRLTVQFELFSLCLHNNRHMLVSLCNAFGWIEINRVSLIGCDSLVIIQHIKGLLSDLICVVINILPTYILLCNKITLPNKVRWEFPSRYWIKCTTSGPWTKYINFY